MLAKRLESLVRLPEAAEPAFVTAKLGRIPGTCSRLLVCCSPYCSCCCCCPSLCRYSATALPILLAVLTSGWALGFIGSFSHLNDNDDVVHNMPWPAGASY